MNKLTALIIAAVSFGLVAPQAMADSYLSASDFFYAESIENALEVNNAANIKDKTYNSTGDADLSASDFFYGYAAGDPVETAHTSGFQERRDVATGSIGQITPEIFYGYSDVKKIDEKCNCTECKC